MHLGAGQKVGIKKGQDFFEVCVEVQLRHPCMPGKLYF